MSTNLAEPSLCSFISYVKVKKWLKIVILCGVFLFGMWSVSINPLISYSVSEQQAEITNEKAVLVYFQEVIITGYSSTPDQTDDTPFITASNKHVEDGIIASNFLPFGTKVRFPKLFGDRIFVVEDRMNRRFSERVDIWFSERHLAEEFGIQKSIMEVVL